MTRRVKNEQQSPNYQAEGRALGSMGHAVRVEQARAVMAVNGNGNGVGPGRPPVATQFGGPVGNPAGRPPGRKTRIQFQTQFIADLAEAWAELGKGVLKIVAKEEPAKFMMACVALQPKQVEADVGLFTDLSDDDLGALLDHVRAQRAKLIEERPVDDGSET
jgi:hypothetical protein